MLINGQTHLVLESDFPNKRFSQIENIDQKVNEASAKEVVKDFESLKYINRDRDTIKEYIIKYGAVSISVKSDKQWDNYKGGIYHNDEVTQYRGGHQVVIIGWDDNYSRNNFVYEKPKSNGAWLILNSWGTQWGNKGTAWVSYEDYGIDLKNTQFIGSVTLANGEIIKTEDIEEDKEKQKEHDRQIEEIKREQAGLDRQDNTQQIEQSKKQNIFEIESMQNIFIILFVVAFILLITGIILKSSQKKKNK